MESQGEGPEAVGVAVDGALAGEADVAGGGGLLADAAEVGANFRIGGDAKGFVLEGGADGIGEVFLDGSGELDAFDAGAEFLAGALGELAPDAGLIDAAAFDGRMSEKVVKGFLLGVEGGVLKAEDLPGEMDIADFFEEPEDGEVVIATDVHAEEKR